MKAENIFSLTSHTRIAVMLGEEVDKLEVINREVRELLQRHPEAVSERMLPTCPITPLIWAANQNLTPVIRTLIEFGADVNAQGQSGQTALIRSVSYLTTTERNKEIPLDSLRILLENGADPNLPDNSGRTPLFWPTLVYVDKRWQRNKAIFDLLIAYGADPTVRDNDGNTLLHDFGDNLPIFHALIEKGLDINARNHKGQTPLVCMAQERPFRTIKAMIAAGADIEIRDEQGRGLLHLLAVDTETDDTRPMRMLIKLGADIHARDNLGRTPLHYAAGAHHYYALIVLLGAGADPRVRDAEGRTAEDIALSGEYWGTLAHYEPEEMGDPERFAKMQQKMARMLRRKADALTASA